MKKRKLFICIICIGLFFHVKINKGQSLDSLKSLLETTTEDTTRINVLNELSWWYSDSKPELANNYANQALGLSKKINATEKILLQLNLLAFSHIHIQHFDGDIVKVFHIFADI